MSQSQHEITIPGLYEPEHEQLECIDSWEEDPCKGPVEYRMALSSTGFSYPRCDAHWFERYDHEMALRQRYPEHAPSDFDPLDAGEAWGEDDY